MPQHNEYLILNSVDPPNMEKEKDMFVFRYKDLTEEAQSKFARLIKWDSSIFTIRRCAKENQIKHVLGVLNPIVMRGGWNGGFSHSTLYRWYESRISRLIFHSLFRRVPTVRRYDLESTLQTPGINLIGNSHH